MKGLIWSLGVASILLAGPAAAGAATTKAVPSDAQLKSRIEHRLAVDRTLKHDHVTVDVDHRVATLSGHVESRADQRRADRLAHMRGVVRVDDHMSVETRGTTGVKDTASVKGNHAVDKVKGTTGTVTEKTKEGLSKTGEAITDSWITGHVKTRFIGEDALKGSKINVDTNDHIVTLKGTVASAAGRARAVELAKTTDGVHSVVDRLVIAPEHK